MQGNGKVSMTLFVSSNAATETFEDCFVGGSIDELKDNFIEYLLSLMRKNHCIPGEYCVNVTIESDGEYVEGEEIWVNIPENYEDKNIWI